MLRYAAQMSYLNCSYRYIYCNAADFHSKSLAKRIILDISLVIFMIYYRNTIFQCNKSIRIISGSATSFPLLVEVAFIPIYVYCTILATP